MDIPDIPNPEKSDEEQKNIIPTNPDFPTEPGLNKLFPREIRKEVRKEWHWFLFLRQMTYKEIEAITGFERTTIWKDIKEVQEELSQHPIDHEATRQLALMSLRVLSAEVITRARESKNDNSAAKLYGEAADIQKTILERFTQQVSLGDSMTRETVDKMQAIIDFMIEKYGPESLDDFEVWYSKRRVAKATMRSSQ